MISAKIENTILKYNMLEAGNTVVVGVSGGADSMLLLTYLAENRKRYGITLIAANVEHGIRGEDSLRDTSFVKAQCERLGVELRLLAINAPEEAKAEGLGVEEYSRNRRYEFFSSLGADKIATAHNLSDNVETVLFRLARGTALRGMCGIPPVRDNIIRPLIDCTGEEIRAYCDEKGIEYVVDSTNSDNSYSRNYIRNVIIPDFVKLNPSFETAVSRFISSASEDEKYLSERASHLTYPLSVEALLKEDPAVAKRAIQGCASLYGVTLDETHLGEVYSLLGRNGRVQIKNTLFAVCDGFYLSFKRCDGEEKRFSFKDESLVVTKKDFNENGGAYKKEYSFICDASKLCGALSVRSRQEGDRISPSGRNCSKSLKKLMNEFKIPGEKRSRVPVVCDEKGIIGLYSYAVDERVKTDSNTEAYCLLKISVEEID
ncbi:MAG: tRNA lysidine(34) synthetase TilS [Eubacterium sp.]|nr:tRNA lysidine(34) synthetase TilS [Eubacterium sp.]